MCYNFYEPLTCFGSLSLLIDFITTLLIFQYVINSYGTMKLLREKGCKDYIGAWVPIYRNYLLGKLLKEECKDVSFINEWLFSLGGLTIFVPFFGIFAAITYEIYRLVCLYEISKKYDNEVSMIIFGLLDFYGVGCSITAANIKEYRKKEQLKNFVKRQQEQVVQEPIYECSCEENHECTCGGTCECHQEEKLDLNKE